MDQTTLTTGALATGAGYIAQLMVNLYTLRNPDRPRWLPPTAAIVIGIVAAFGLYVQANGWVWRAQDVATVVLTGLIAGALAVLGATQQSKADAERAASTYTVKTVDGARADPAAEG